MNEPILHDEPEKRFYCIVNGKVCSINYDLKGTNPETMDIFRTFVDPDLRGRGIAENLMKSITEFAIKKQYFIVPSCSYAVVYLKKHPNTGVKLAPGVDLQNGGSCRIK